MHEHAITSLKVIDKIWETPDAVTLVLESSNPNEIVHYTSGQFITFVFTTPFGNKKRSYSISSSPSLQEPLSVTVKRVENGEFSRTLVLDTAIGDSLYMDGIGGQFVLPNEPNQFNYLFLAAGSGITPIFSIIKTLMHDTNAKAMLLYSNAGIKQTIFYDALKQLAHQYPDRLTIRFFFSDDEQLLERRLSSTLLDQILQTNYTASKEKLQAYLCGPFLYMDSAGIVLRSFGVPAEQIHAEDFHPPTLDELPKPPDLNAQQVTILLNNTSHTITVQYPDSISKAAQAADLPVPFSCESGQCGSCMAKLIKGEIWMAYNEVLTDREIENGLRLTCMGFPVHGDVTVQF